MELIEDPIVTRLGEIIESHPEITNYLNWIETSKLPMNIHRVRAWQDYLVWDMVSQYQPLTVEIANEFDKRLRYDLVSKNKNVNPEVLKAKIDRMDFEVVQTHQTFTADLIKHFWEQIEPKLIIKYQTDLPEDIIYEIMERVIPTLNDVNEIKSYMRLVLQYQTVSEAFIRAFMESPEHPREPGESSAPGKPGKPGKRSKFWSRVREFLPRSESISYHVIDLRMVVQYQQVSEEFLIEHIVGDAELIAVAVKTQKMSMGFIRDHMNKMPMKKLLKHQPLSDEFLQKEIIPTLRSMNVAQLMETVSIILKNQTVDFKTCEYIIKRMCKTLRKAGRSDRTENNLTFDSWMLVFLRLNSQGGERFNNIKPLKWKSKDRTKVRARLNWTRIAKNNLSSGHVERCLTRYIKNVPLYTFLKNNPVTEEIARDLNSAGHLGVMEWWILLTKNHKRSDDDPRKLPESFTNAHADRLLWWKYVNQDTLIKFYEDCLRVIHMDEDGSEDENISATGADDDERSLSLSEADIQGETGITRGAVRKIFHYDLKRFLNDFVRDADWAHILRYEELDEWFIRLFANFENKIDMYWWKVARYQKLSTKFISKYIGEMDMNIVLGYQTLSEDMIRTLIPFLEEDAWDKVAKYQPISSDFIREFHHMLPESSLAQNPLVAH